MKDSLKSNVFPSSATAVKQVFLTLTHQIYPTLYENFKKISSATSDLGDSVLLLHGHEHPGMNFIRSSLNPYIFTDESLARIGFPMFTENMVPGSTHFPLLEFAKLYPSYEYYWLIEHDVRFRGNWQRLFHHFSSNRADLLTCHIRKYDEEPDWHWWDLQHPDEFVPIKERYRSFNPIYRISRNALQYVLAMHREHWRGHYEVLMPTLLYRGGFMLQDFGGTGQFVAPGERNLFYLDGPEHRRGILRKGTMRFRPLFRRAGWRWNKLYHPVKPPRPCDYNASYLKE